MSDPPSSSPRSEPENPNPQSHPPSSSTPSQPQPQPQQQQQQQQTPSTPNPNPAVTVVPPAPVAISPYGLPMTGAPAPLSFRPVPQFSPLPNYQNAAPGVHPPGVSSAAAPAPIMGYQVPPGQPPNPVLRPYGAPPIPNGYSAVPPVGGVAAPPGIPRYPTLPMVRPLFPPRPPGAPVVLPAASRPMVPGAPNVRPAIAPLVRPIIPSVTPAEKPQISVYVGKIASTVEDDFMHSVLQVCGPVKNWKRAQDPNGTLRGFGFCEYESAEGLLRALRLFSKFNIDGQELLLNITGATKEYLKRYVQKKTENLKNVKKDEGAGSDNVEEAAKGGEKNEPPKSSVEDSSNETDKDKKIHDLAYSGIVTDEDKEADREALEKLASMIEERLKNKPLPPPPPQLPADGTGNLNSDMPAKSRDGESDADKARSGTEDKNDDETTSDNKAASELDRADTSSPDRRRYDRRSRDRDRDIKREKEREIERYERETERERIRKEREQRRKTEEAEREYEERLKDWEYREREKEKQRQYEKDKEKERERKRRKEILYDEEEDDDDSRKRWRRSALEEKRRKRLREKEEDLADRIKEEEEIVEAKRRSEVEMLQKQQNDTLNLSSGHAVNGSETMELAEEYDDESKEKGADQDDIGSFIKNHIGGVLQNPNADESTISEGDMRQNNNAPATRKLGFGLVGSGKRAVVPSVFNEEDDDDAHKDKRMRPLVPIDYSTEEMQAVQPTVSGAQPNLVAAAEFARLISNVPGKDEKTDGERERNRRYNDRSSQRERDRDQNDESINRTKDDNKEKILERERDREHGLDKVKTPDKQKLLDAKQLIDMIPKTKDELFSHEINWAVYDKHELHERMRPWISKKITEFLGEEETTLVDYIVSSTQEHVKASKMLELLQSILDEEAEMFVLKMWRMLIFEIKKVETGLAFKSKT